MSIEIYKEVCDDINAILGDRFKTFFVTFRKNRRLQNVKSIMDTYPDIKGVLLRTPLMYVVYKKYDINYTPALISIMIEAGSDLNAVDVNGYPALIYAIEFGNYNAARILIECGASVNIIYNNGITPLTLAIDRSKLESSITFIKFLASKVTNTDMMNIAMECLFSGISKKVITVYCAYSIFEVLCEYNIESDALYKSAKYLLDYVKKNKSDINTQRKHMCIKMLLELIVRSDNRFDILIEVMRTYDVIYRIMNKVVVSEFIGDMLHTINVNQQNSDGETLLSVLLANTSEYRRSDVTTLILKIAANGIDANAKLLGIGSTYLMSVVSRPIDSMNLLYVVATLMACGFSKFSATDDRGWNALIYAMKTPKQNNSIASELVECGVDPYILTKSADTVLTVLDKSNGVSAKFLAQLGVNMYYKNALGESFFTKSDTTLLKSLSLEGLRLEKKDLNGFEAEKVDVLSEYVRIYEEHKVSMKPVLCSIYNSNIPQLWVKYKFWMDLLNEYDCITIDPIYTIILPISSNILTKKDVRSLIAYL